MTNRVHMTEEWTKDPYASEWLNKLPTDRTRINYIQRFPLWLNFIQMPPTEQIKKRISDLQSNDPKARGWFEDKVGEFTRMLVTQGYKPMSIQSYQTPVLSLFSSHRVKLSFRRGELKVSTRTEDKVVTARALICNALV